MRVLLARRIPGEDHVVTTVVAGRVRQNYLFVGNVAAEQSLARLYSLVATCESRGINPYEYLTDVLRRVQEHPAKHLDELLPGPWAAAR